MNKISKNSYAEVVDVYKDAIEDMAEEVTNAGGKRKIRFLEEWIYRYLIPDVKDNCPERLSEIRNYARNKITKIRHGSIGHGSIA